MMIALGFYCGNSVAEKGILGYFNAKQSNQPMKMILKFN